MKYLNSILTVIAICLILITCAVTGIIPAANAKERTPNFVNIPVNPDGSLNVKLVKGEIMDVNIDEIGGQSQMSSGILKTSINFVGYKMVQNAIPVEASKGF